MISINTAKKLKAAGLKWETKTGDLWIDTEDPQRLRAVDWEPTEHEKPLDKNIWLPRLDQLMAEIGKRGYQMRLTKLAAWRVSLWRYWTCGTRAFREEIPEEAAAAALLWIFDEERKGER